MDDRFNSLYQDMDNHKSTAMAFFVFISSLDYKGFSAPFISQQKEMNDKNSPLGESLAEINAALGPF